jgi:hypothetical protein
MKVKPHQHNHVWLKTGIWLSTICLIHCITFPIIIALLPVFKIAFAVNHYVEVGLLLSTAAIGTYSLWHGFKLHHKKISPLLLFFSGVILMFILHLNHHHEGFSFLRVFGEISGALFIASSLFLNLRLTKTHACTTAH